MPGDSQVLRQFTTTGLVLLASAAAVLLAWLSVRVNLERTCTTQDTPYFDLCSTRLPGDKENLAALRRRIAANPGDANAYVQLAQLDASTERSHLVDTAARLAPTNPTILMAQATAALERQDWPKAIGPLVQLTEYGDSPQPPLILARLIAGGQGKLLAPHLTPGSRWFQRVLAQVSQLPGYFSAALPLVAQALKVGILDTDAVRGYVRQLKASGAWADAYALWVTLHGKPVPVLYNSRFDEPFQPDGFDWELAPPAPANRTGALIERRRAEERGSVLDIRFTGRAIPVPLVRQYLFLGEGRYRLRGDYTARQLRIEDGLAWSVRCGKEASLAGRSSALRDTGGLWQPFAFDFSVPRGCGLVASLQLETYSPLDAALGAQGRVAFNAFALEKLPAASR